MLSNPIPVRLGRLLSKSIQNDSVYSSWMRDYLSPREYYGLRSLMSSRDSFSSLLFQGSRQIQSLGINYLPQDVDCLLRINGLIASVLLFYRAGLLTRKSNYNSVFLEILRTNLLHSRILSSSFFSSRLANLAKFKPYMGKYLFLAPVCPDYAYTMLSPTTYRYTFDGVGGGIGLVAQNAIKNAKHLLDLVADSPDLTRRIDFYILVGDFEAKESNLSSLRLTFDVFLDKIDSSVDTIRKSTPFHSCRITDYCGGFRNWLAHEDCIQSRYKLYSYDALTRAFPSINHQKVLFSRLPLYQKWFGVGKDYKSIFVSQVIEYLLMGKLFYDYYGDSCCLFASDHRAMRPYYSGIVNIPTIGSASNY